MIMASRLDQSSRCASSAARRGSQVQKARAMVWHPVVSRLPAAGFLQPREGFIGKLKRESLTVVHVQPGDSQEGISASPSEAPNTELSAKKPPTVTSEKKASRAGMETPDMISTQLTRRFGCALL